MKAYEGRLTEVKKERILKLKLEGLDAKTISFRLGVSIWTIHNFLRRHKGLLKNYKEKKK